MPTLPNRYSNHIDSARDLTRGREWVADAFKTNKPFEQFTAEQPSGDLIPGATVARKVAREFSRTHRITYEGGAIPAESHT